MASPDTITPLIVDRANPVILFNRKPVALYYIWRRGSGLMSWMQC